MRLFLNFSGNISCFPIGHRLNFSRRRAKKKSMPTHNLTANTVARLCLSNGLKSTITASNIEKIAYPQYFKMLASVYCPSAYMSAPTDPKICRILAEKDEETPFTRSNRITSYAKSAAAKAKSIPDQAESHQLQKSGLRLAECVTTVNYPSNNSLPNPLNAGPKRHQPPSSKHLPQSIS